MQYQAFSYKVLKDGKWMGPINRMDETTAKKAAKSHPGAILTIEISLEEYKRLKKLATCE